MSTDTGPDPTGASPPLPHLLRAPSAAGSRLHNSPRVGGGDAGAATPCPGMSQAAAGSRGAPGKGGPAAGGLPCRQALPTQSRQNRAQPSKLGLGVGYTVTNASSPGWGELCILKQPGRTQQEIYRCTCHTASWGSPESLHPFLNFIPQQIPRVVVPAACREEPEPMEMWPVPVGWQG